MIVRGGHLAAAFSFCQAVVCGAVRDGGKRALMCVLLFACSSLAVAAGLQKLQVWRGGATPALELSDIEGVRHRLADYRGKVVLLNFWATWCEPCRDEMPAMQRLKQRFAERPFVVIAVNVRESEARIAEFRQRLPLDFIFLRDHSGSAMKAWRAPALPASFLIGADGRIRYSHIGELDWDDETLAAVVAKQIGR